MADEHFSDVTDKDGQPLTWRELAERRGRVLRYLANEMEDFDWELWWERLDWEDNAHRRALNLGIRGGLRRVVDGTYWVDGSPHDLTMDELAAWLAEREAEDG
jgi:hypothetical protein